jgi:spore maturation protein CgeB
LKEFLVDPIRALGLRARFYGVRYPDVAVRTLRSAGIDYAGWIPDFCVPAALAAGRFTVHLPRHPHNGLPRPTAIRVFEALACGVPLVAAPWDECKELFNPGTDLLTAQDGQQMERHLMDLHGDADFAQAIADRGYRTVLSRHTCAHRVDELLEICRELGAKEPAEASEEIEETPVAVVPPPVHTVPPESARIPVAWS